MEDLEKRYGNPYLWGYTEFELIEDLTESMKKAREQGINIKVRLRLHPNEKYEKYDEYIKKCPCMEKSENKNLLTDIAWSDKVIGCESVAMAIALNLGRKVYCCMPENENKTCALPFPEIIRLKNFDNILK
jgi:hypothetical protein